MASEKDRFDKLPRTRGRVGAHRGPRKGRGWPWFWVVIAILAAGALTFAAIRVAGTFIDLDLSFFTGPTATTTAGATSSAPIVSNPKDLDPKRGVKIRVLNGTRSTSAAQKVHNQLKKAGWPITGDVFDVGGGKVKDTIVYYANPADVDVARGLAAAMGVGEVQAVDPSTYPGAAITIIVGQDSKYYPKSSSTPTDASTGVAGP